MAAGSTRSDTLLTVITDAAGDPDPMIRQHSLWAAARIEGSAARSRLEGALKAETETSVITEIKSLLDGTGDVE